MKPPDFFLIGAPKCGTTALAEYLRRHPAVFFPELKEPNFFNTDLAYPLRHKDLADYLTLFEGADASRHLAVGEGTTSYLFSDRAVPNILAFEPQARFIVMLRDPVDLVAAWHSQIVFMGHEGITDFQRAWRAEADRREGRRLPRSWPEPRRFFYSEWGKLGGQVERLLSRVEASRVHFILYEDFASRTREVYEGVLSFLGLPSDGREDFPVVHGNHQVRFLPLHRAIRIAALLLASAKERLGIRRQGLGLLSKMASFTIRSGKRPPMDPAFRAELKAFYRDEVLKLSSLIGRDLSKWLSP